MSTFDDIKEAIAQALPSEARIYSADFAKLLANVIDGIKTDEDLRYIINSTPHYRELFSRLIGQNIKTERALIVFEQDNKMNDVKISHVAGNDIIELKINIYCESIIGQQEVKRSKLPTPSLKINKYHSAIGMSCIITLVVLILNASSHPIGSEITSPDNQAPALRNWNSSTKPSKLTLNVTNRMGDSVLPVGYPNQLHLDNSTHPTALELYNASLSINKGDDIRIVYENSREIPRYIEKFNRNEVDIWFATQSDIPASNQSSSYSLYYGNRDASNPGFERSSIFIPHKDNYTRLLLYFDEGQGKYVADESGNENHGTIEGSLDSVWQEGKVGSGLHFNKGTLVKIEDSKSLQITNQIAIEAWIRPTSVGNDTNNIVSKIAPGGEARRFAFRMFLNQGVLFFMIYSDHDEANVRSPYPLEANRWYHVAGIYDGNHMRLFINGKESASVEYNKPINPGNTWIAIGSTGYREEYFVGDIDMVKISTNSQVSFPFARVSLNPVVQISP